MGLHISIQLFTPIFVRSANWHPMLSVRLLSISGALVYGGNLLAKHKMHGMLAGERNLMSNVKINYEGVFALIEKDETLIAKIDLATVTLATVKSVEMQPPFNMPARRSRDLVIVSNGVTISVRIRDDDAPETFSEHSAYALLKEFTENMP